MDAPVAAGGWTSSLHRPLSTRAGIGLRAPHYQDFLQPGAAAGQVWLEAHAENYFQPGSVRRRMLLAVAERHEISLHGVALSLGSAEGLDPDHLDRLADLVAEVRPVLVSEHLAWSRADGVYYNDLLPLPLTDETLDVVSANVDRVQGRLGRPLLVENPSSYMAIEGSTLGEADFLARLAARTGCGLLLDVNNLFVSAANVGTNIAEWLAAIPGDAVGEIHLAGHARERRGGRSLLIDTHGAAVAEEVWAVYAEVIERFGPRPTLVEWDSELPPLEVLLREAGRAQAMLDGA